MILPRRIIAKALVLLHAFLLLAVYDGVADAFCHQQQRRRTVVNHGHWHPSSTSAFGTRNINSGLSTRSCSAHSKTRIFLVSEEDVIEAVELAESLWEKALEARKEANALIDRAEEEANTSAGTAKQAENIFQDKSKPVSMEDLVQVDNAAKASLEATIMVNEATKASDEADQLEAHAEEALQKSEEILDQHLIDYPDSALAE